MSGHILTFLIHRLGPAGVALGAALEGETAVVLGGAAAGHGFFNPVASAIAAWAGSFLADQLVFWASRYESHRPFLRGLTEKPAFDRALRFIDRHPRLFCFGFRFIYGFRIAGPAAVGASSVPGRTFIVVNALSAALWASLFTFAGFRFGPALLNAIRPLLTVPHVALEVGIFVAGLAAVLIWKNRK